MSPDPMVLRLPLLSLAALPAGGLGAWLLAGAPPILRQVVSGLIVMALMGTTAARAVLMRPPCADLTPLLASAGIAVLVLTPRLGGLDPVLLEAAAASGATPWDRLVLVILPWIGWSCLAALLLCLAADAGLWLSAG